MKSQPYCVTSVSVAEAGLFSLSGPAPAHDWAAARGRGGGAAGATVSEKVAAAVPLILPVAIETVPLLLTEGSILLPTPSLTS